MWKELINWDHIVPKRELSTFIERFGNFYSIKDLMSPQGDFFLKKKERFAYSQATWMNQERVCFLIFLKILQLMDMDLTLIEISKTIILIHYQKKKY